MSPLVFFYVLRNWLYDLWGYSLWSPPFRGCTHWGTLWRPVEYSQHPSLFLSVRLCHFSRCMSWEVPAHENLCGLDLHCLLVLESLIPEAPRVCHRWKVCEWRHLTFSWGAEDTIATIYPHCLCTEGLCFFSKEGVRGVSKGVKGRKLLDHGGCIPYTLSGHLLFPGLSP